MLEISIDELKIDQKHIMFTYSANTNEGVLSFDYNKKTKDKLEELLSLRSLNSQLLVTSDGLVVLHIPINFKKDLSVLMFDEKHIRIELYFDKAGTP